MAKRQSKANPRRPRSAEDEKVLPEEKASVEPEEEKASVEPEEEKESEKVETYLVELVDGAAYRVAGCVFRAGRPVVVSDPRILSAVFGNSRFKTRSL